LSIDRSTTQKNAEDHLPLAEATCLILISLARPKHGYAIM
jgi:hypothetical protein